MMNQIAVPPKLNFRFQYGGKSDQIFMRCYGQFDSSDVDKGLLQFAVESFTVVQSMTFLLISFAAGRACDSSVCQGCQ